MGMDGASCKLCGTVIEGTYWEAEDESEEPDDNLFGLVFDHLFREGIDGHPPLENGTCRMCRQFVGEDNKAVADHFGNNHLDEIYDDLARCRCGKWMWAVEDEGLWRCPDCGYEEPEDDSPVPRWVAESK